MKLLAKIFDLYQKVSPSKQNAFHYFVITLPILFSFQNCGSQKFNSQMVDLSSNSSNILGVVPPICSPTQSRVCKENNGVGFQFCETDGTPRACQIESCESGFTLKNGKCEPQSCKPTTTASCEGLNGSGVRTCNSDGLGFGACVLNKCSVGYELDVVTKICKPLACVPNTSLGCNIANGVGLQTCKSDGSGYMACKLQSCNTGYKPSGDFCVANCTAGEKQNCSENNGSGARTCLSSGSGFGACQLNACNDGYNLQKGVCVANLCAPNTDSNCTAGNGSGVQRCNAQGTGYGACQLNACQTGYALVNGSCIPKICEANKASACAVENGAGEKMCNATGTGYSACEVKSCQDGYDITAGQCTLNLNNDYLWNNFAYNNLLVVKGKLYKIPELNNTRALGYYYRVSNKGYKFAENVTAIRFGGWGHGLYSVYDSILNTSTILQLGSQDPLDSERYWVPINVLGRVFKISKWDPASWTMDFVLSDLGIYFLFPDCENNKCTRITKKVDWINRPDLTVTDAIYMYKNNHFYFLTKSGHLIHFYQNPKTMNREASINRLNELFNSARQKCESKQNGLYLYSTEECIQLLTSQSSDLKLIESNVAKIDAKFNQGFGDNGLICYLKLNNLYCGFGLSFSNVTSDKILLFHITDYWEGGNDIGTNQICYVTTDKILKCSTFLNKFLSSRGGTISSSMLDKSQINISQLDPVEISFTSLNYDSGAVSVRSRQGKIYEVKSTTSDQRPPQLVFDPSNPPFVD